MSSLFVIISQFYDAQHTTVGRRVAIAHCCARLLLVERGNVTVQIRFNFSEKVAKFARVGQKHDQTLDSQSIVMKC